MKTVPAAAFPGRCRVEDRDICGVVQTAGIASFAVGGTSTLADGLTEDLGTRTAADGSIDLLTGKPEEVLLYLVAGSDTTPPRGRRLARRDGRHRRHLLPRPRDDRTHADPARRVRHGERDRANTTNPGGTLPHDALCLPSHSCSFPGGATPSSSSSRPSASP
jgi:hypothetical protein